MMAGEPAMKLLEYIKLLRPHQYVKNLFIFVPLFFALQITNTALLFDAFIAFLAFSMSASAVYILNDYLDIEDDRQHPKKKLRPLASGAVNAKVALGIMLILWILGCLLMMSQSHSALAILASYIVLNIAYCFGLKHIAILDVVIISVGFVLRLFIGSAVTGIALSQWIVIMTFLLALFMALAKRRDDVLIFDDTGKKMRKVIDGYNLAFLDGAMMIMASVVIVTYILYTTIPNAVQRLHDEYLYLTSLFVILGIMRYLQVSFVEKNSGSPTKILLKDKFMQLTIICWALSFAWILYI